MQAAWLTEKWIWLPYGKVVPIDLDSVILIAIDQIRNSNRFTERFSQAVSAAGYRVCRIGYSPIALSRANILIFHWPTMFTNAQGIRDWFRAAVILACKKIFQYKLVWVAHNATEHEGRSDYSRSRPAKRFFASLDGVIYLSEASKEIVLASGRLSENCVHVVITHGWYESSTTPSEYQCAKTQIRFLNFGLVRRYKNLHRLLEISSWNSGPSLRIIGRRMDKKYAQSLEQCALGKALVQLDLRDDRISDEELDAEIDKCDGVILPYDNILNSGAAIHALSRHRPVLAPTKGSIPELSNLIGPEWVTTFDPPIDAEDLRNFEDHLRGMVTRAPDLTALGWKEIEIRIAHFLEKLSGQ